MALVVGQKVTVKIGLTSERKYEGCFYPEQMAQHWAGKEVTIHRVWTDDSSPRYRIKEDMDNWTWVESFFDVKPRTADEIFEDFLKGKISEKEYAKLRRERG